jgi:hypothetical protein
METNSDTNLWKRLLTSISTFSKICAGFAIITVLIIFFELDISRILTPFIEPFLLIFFLLVFVVLAIASLVHIPKRFNANPLDAFLPFSINALTAVTVFFFFFPLQDLRVDIEFAIKSDKYQQIVEWVDESIQNGEIELETNRLDVILLPEEYRGSTTFDRIIVKRHKYGISVFMSPWAGMFEYNPGFVYRSDDTFPSDDFAEIECHRKIQPHWFYCS